MDKNLKKRCQTRSVNRHYEVFTSNSKIKFWKECCTVVVGFSYFIHPNIICCTFSHHYIDHCVMLHILHVVTRCYQKDYFPSSTHFVCYLFTCWIPVKYLAVLMSVSIKWKFECDLFLSSDCINTFSWFLASQLQMAHNRKKISLVKNIHYRSLIADILYPIFLDQ